MRLSISILLGLAAASTAQASGELEKRGDDGGAPESTKFNGEEVPPMVQLSGASFDEDISKGNWYVNRLISC